MKRDIFKLLMLAMLLLGGAACSKSDVETQGTINADISSAELNKRGLTNLGETLSIQVTSSVYWVIEDEYSWLTVTPKAGCGKTVLNIKVDPNYGDSRTAELNLVAYDSNVSFPIEIQQSSVGEAVYYGTASFGDEAISEPIAINDYEGLTFEGIGASRIELSGNNASIATPTAASDYEGASGGNAILFDAETDSAVTMGPIDCVEERAFNLAMGILGADGTMLPSDVTIALSNDGENYVDLSSPVTRGESEIEGWAALESKFQITKTDKIWLQVSAPKGYYLDDLSLRDGNEGSGEEIVFNTNLDDGNPYGYVYLQENFDWVTEAGFTSTDYILGHPDGGREIYWNIATDPSLFGQYGVTDAAHEAIVNSGWATSDDKKKERVYLRVGYIKMGRGANTAGCGGGIITPNLNIAENCASTVLVSFDAAAWLSTGSTYDTNKSMMVRILGDGTIDDTGAKEFKFELNTSSETLAKWQVAPADRNPWETIQFIVRGAKNTTQIVFESTEQTTANRWLFDNVKVEKIANSTEGVADPVALDTPVAEFDTENSSDNTVIFNWEANNNAASYAYAYSIDGAEEITGTTAETTLTISELTKGATITFKVMAIPAADSKLYLDSEWSEAINIAVGSATGIPVLSIPSNIKVSNVTEYGFDLTWGEVENATDYGYTVTNSAGEVIIDSYKAWENRVHIGGLDGKSTDRTFNVTLNANHMNYDSGKHEIDQTYDSSKMSEAKVVTLAEATHSVIFQDDFSWLDPECGSNDLSTNTDWINTYCTKDDMERFDKLVEEGHPIVGELNGWNYDSSYYSVYSRPGYVHINSSKAMGSLISPALTALTEATDVTVSFDATMFFQYFSGALDANNTLKAKVKGTGTIEGADAEGFISFTIDQGNAWKNFSFEVKGADATTQIYFVTGAAATNRTQFDNFRVVCSESQSGSSAEALATPVATFDAAAVTYNGVTFSWNTIANATSYDYSYTVNGGTAITGTTNYPYAILTDLAQEANVAFKVMATPAAGNALYLDSEWSEEVTATTLSGLPVLDTPSNIAVNNVTAYGFDLTWDAVENATDYSYTVTNSAGEVIIDSYKSWENRVHIGGLDGRSSDRTFNVTLRANHMNYDSKKVKIEQTHLSSAVSETKVVTLEPSTNSVVFQDDFSWLDPSCGSYGLSSNTDWINTYCTTDDMERFDNLIAEGHPIVSKLNGWSYDSSYYSVYSRPGYIQINKTSGYGSLISPALTALTQPTNVTVSFDAALIYQYFTQALEENNILTAKLVGAGSIEGANTDSIISFTVDQGNAWENFTFNVIGADATTQIFFKTADDYKSRTQFDNFRVVCSESQSGSTPEAIATPVATFDTDEITYSDVTFTWNLVANAKSYDYSYSVNGGEAVTGSTNYSYITISNLMPESNVAFKVMATPAAGNSHYLDSEWSEEVTATTLSGLPILDTPSNIAVSEITAYGFELTWDAVDNATDYSYTVTNSAGEVIIDRNKAWENRVHIGGLDGRSSDRGFKVILVANHMPYGSDKKPIDQTHLSSAASEAMEVTLESTTNSVVFQDDFSWLDPRCGSYWLSTNTDWINTYCTNDKAIRLDYLAKEGFEPVCHLNGWGYDSARYSVYTRPGGYLHMNSSNAYGSLISPALTALSEATDVTVSFDGARFLNYFALVPDANYNLQAKVIGSGTIEGAVDGILTIAIEHGNTWDDYSFDVKGADATTQIYFTPEESGTNRIQFDNFRVVTTE